MADYRFLVIEDDPEILEFNEWVLRTEYPAEIVLCSSHEDALTLLHRNEGLWSAILCDAKTQKGSLDELYLFITEKLPTVPFILVAAGPSSHFTSYKKRRNDYHLAKAYDAFQLLSVTKSALGTEVAASNSEYIAIRFESLKHLEVSPCDLFLKINDEKYSRVADLGVKMSVLDTQKYQRKGAPSLFCRKQDWPLILPATLLSALTNMQMEALRAQPLETIKYSASLQEVLQTTIRNFGWSPELVALANQNVAAVKTVLQSYPEIKLFERVFLDPNYEQALIHSVLLCYVLTAAYQSCPHIQSDSELDVLCLASFLHDGFLEEHQIRNESQYVSSVVLKIGANKEDRMAVEKHPESIFEAIKNWKEAPRNLSTILFEHHERPDGKGFPRKLKSLEISRLSLAFIVAHELTELYLQTRDLNRVINEFSKFQSVFDSGPYSFYKCCQEMLKKST